MKVAVIGAAGSVGELVLMELKKKDYETVAVINEINRKPEIEKLGASKVVVSTGNHYDEALSGCHAVVYISGISQSAGENKTVLIDHEDVMDSIDAAKRQGIERFVLMSAIRAHEPEDSDSRSIGAKHEPDELLQQEDFKYTIVRPSHLVDKPGKKRIQTGKGLSTDGEIPKEDVAAVLVEVLNNKSAFNKTFEITTGEIPIIEAF